MSSKRILNSKLPSFINQEVTVKGWLHKKREISKKLLFILLRDRTGLVQIVVESETEIQKLSHLQSGSILSTTATVTKEQRSPSGVELINPLIEVEVAITENSPIEIDKEISHKPENYQTLFEYRPMGLRNLQEQSVFKIQAGIYKAIHNFMHSHDFTEFRSPKLLGAATEGGAETFELDYFGKTATLAQSAQFYKQIMVGVFERVYEIGATYRAEQSFTTRHMTEFTTLDVEIGFIDSFEDVLVLAESLLKQICNGIFSSHSPLLNLWEAKQPVLPDIIPRVTLNQVHQLYYQNVGIDNREEKDPTPDEEKFICDYSSKNWNSEAVFITEFPASDMKFYHYINEQNPTVCDRADLIFRGVEIATLSKREHRYDRLLAQMRSKGINPQEEGYKAYLLAFKHGLPPHGGFGLGLERLTQKILGLKSVKEACLFPRDVKRLSP